jgi:hypothetical protein
LIFRSGFPIILFYRPKSDAPRIRHSPRLGLLALCLAAGLSVFCASAQQTGASLQPATPPGTPLSWIQTAANNELQIITNSGNPPLRYRVHKIDAKGDVVRDVIESKDGAVARLIERDGFPITPSEDAAELVRLQAILDSPADFIRHHRRSDSTRDDTLQLVKLMPHAMICTYAPGQPQLPNIPTPQVVLDFSPDPAFHPPNMASDLLTGLAGRLWIDSRTGRMTRVEGHVLRPVNFGWGIVGRIYPGGTIVLDQTQPLPGRWIYSRLDTNLSMRVIVKTVTMTDHMSAFGFQPLPAPMTVQQAVHALLDTHIPPH